MKLRAIGPIFFSVKSPHDTVHGLFVAQFAEGPARDNAQCPMCANEGSEAGVKTYSEEEFRTAVADATRIATDSLRQRLDELESAQAQGAVATAVATAVAEATAPLEARAADLQTALDAKVLEHQAAVTAAETAEAARKALEDSVAEEKRLAAEAVTASERRQSRVDAVAAVVTFPADHVEKCADGWAALTDEAFAAQLDGFRVLAETYPTATPPVPVSTAPPARSPLTAADHTKPPTGSAISDDLREVFAARENGVNLKGVSA